jgi:hypothetical protein
MDREIEHGKPKLQSRLNQRAHRRYSQYAPTKFEIDNYEVGKRPRVQAQLAAWSSKEAAAHLGICCPRIWN